MAKKTNRPQQLISPKKYIIEAARKVPVFECVINEDWAEGGMAQIMVARQKQHGNFIVGVYVVDTFCLGLKNTLFYENMSPYEYREQKEKITRSTNMNWEKISPNTCFNIIYGAIEYAEDLGFQPNKDFAVTEYILDDVESIKFEEIEFGQNGKPYYFAGPYDDARKIMATLKRSVGEGNFDYTLPVDGSGNSLSRYDREVSNDFFEDEEDEEDDNDDNDEPHLPMIGLDFTLKKESTIDFRYDDFLRSEAKLKDLTLVADEIVLNEVLEFDEENIPIISYMIKKYSIATKSTNLYLTIPLGVISQQKQTIITKLLRKNKKDDDFSFTTTLQYDNFIAHFPTLRQFDGLKKLLEISPMLHYANRIITILNELESIKENYKISTFIVYGEKEFHGENEDHISIGFTIEHK